MLIYVLFVVFISMFSILQLRNSKENKVNKYCWTVTCASVILLAGLRYGLETDYWHYYKMFDGTTVVAATEPLFSLLIMTVRIFTKDYNIFVLLIAVVSLGIKLHVFEKFKYCFVVLLLYFLRYYILFELNAIRQGLAVSFVLLAIYYLTQNNKKQFLIYVSIASLLHASSIFALVALVIKEKKINFRIVISICLGAIIGRLFLIEKLLLLGGNYTSFVFNSSNNLINGTKYVLYNNHISEVDLMSILRVIIPVICLYVLQSRIGKYETSEKAKKYYFLFKIYIIGASINLLFLGYDTIGYRLASIFYCVECLLIGYSLERKRAYSINRINVKNLFCYCTLIACDLWSFTGIMMSSETLIPYKTFLFR